MTEIINQHTAGWVEWETYTADPLHYRCVCGRAEWHVNTSADYYEAHAAHVADALTKAGHGDLDEARAAELEAAADRFDIRSETLLKTMKNMAGHPDTTPDDVVRYGAYSAEANTAAHWLRARAAVIRAEGAN